MPYFVLQSPVGPDARLADFMPYHEFDGNWLAGSVLDPPPPDPIELTWDPDNEAGVRVAFYEVSVPLMTKELVTSLRAAGVDNLDTYPVVIHSSTGGDDCHDYVAVNILGAIAAADMDASEVEDLGAGDGMGDVLFASLVIDETKTGGKLLFRLAQCVTATIIHSNIVQRLQAAGGFGLTFLNPEEYAG